MGNSLLMDIYQAFEEELPNTYLSIEIRKRAVKMLKKIKKTVKTLVHKLVDHKLVYRLHFLGF